MKELAALAYRDTTAENREFWKNEMGQALREIQGVYEDKMDTMRNEIEASYSLKVTKAQFTPPTTSWVDSRRRRRCELGITSFRFIVSFFFQVFAFCKIITKWSEELFLYLYFIVKSSHIWYVTRNLS